MTADGAPRLASIAIQAQRITRFMLLGALKATSAATVQLSVPVIAALGGIVFLGEAVTLRFVLASAAVLGGIALVILNPPSRRD